MDQKEIDEKEFENERLRDAHKKVVPNQNDKPDSE